MKNIFKVTGLAIALNIALPSCNKMLEPKPYGQQSIDATFSDFAGTVSAVNGMYNPLSGTDPVLSGGLYRGRNALLYVDYASDDVVGSETGSGSNYNKLDYFELSPADNQPFDLWDGLYRIIYRANVVIDRVPGLNLTANQALNSAGLPFKDQFVGEARFLRAFAYFNLVRLFGDVPVHLKPITSPDQVNVPRTPAAQVYTQIVDDLKAARTLLPPSYNDSGAGNEKGRPTRWSAAAVLADVYLTLKQYSDALNSAQEVITQSDRVLHNRYIDNFPARTATGTGTTATLGPENTRESLFEVQFASDRATGTAPYGNGYSTVMGAVTEINGSNPSVAAYRPTDNEDPDIEPGFTGGLIQEYETLTIGATATEDLRKGVNFRRALGSNNRQRWLTWKHHVEGTGSVGAVNFPVYRLAEMYLIYAESSNELGLLNATGLGYLNSLRRRAFGLPLTTANTVVDVPTGLNQAAYRDRIRSERRRELAMENKRWFDLQRYGFNYANDVLVNKQKRTRFTAEKLLLPISRDELINNPKLVQNTGYPTR